jgi:hypothetical protein
MGDTDMLSTSVCVFPLSFTTPFSIYICFADQVGYITVQVEGNPAPTFKWYKVRNNPHLYLGN